MANVVKRVEHYVKPFRVTNGKKFRLNDIDPGDTAGLKSKEQAEEWLAKGVEWLADLQGKLYADSRWRCCSSSRPWTRPARTAPLNTSCRA